MDIIYNYFRRAFEEKLVNLPVSSRRIGSELKFPLVRENGEAASYETVCELWLYLAERGWEPFIDPATGEVAGARKPGEFNYTVASCETGFCKTEFSMAHVGDLMQLERDIAALRRELRPFAEKHNVRFLGYGIQPVTPPGRDLLMKKGRAGVFDRILRGNRMIPEDRGHDLHLFTINAATHVHLSTSVEEAVPLVNVLNAFAGAQIALTAHSNVWRGAIDDDYKCVAEKFWDWWMPDCGRVGVPDRPFEDLADYVNTISRFKPFFVKRDGKPIILDDYDSFEKYFLTGRARGTDLAGRKVSFVPQDDDIDLHGSCYWFNARISQYFTVENRANDEQPPDDLLCVPALTLGLAHALPEALEEIDDIGWEKLGGLREAACRGALTDPVKGEELTSLSGKMLELAYLGLERRRMGERDYLAPLVERLKLKKCPADEAATSFRRGGAESLVGGLAI